MEHSVFGLKPGVLIQNTYRIESLLGEGGMGATFRATNVATGHAVAVKVMTPAFAANKRAVDLFRRESNLLRSVRNDAVIGYETTLLDNDGRLFLVMEYADGKPLSYYIKKGARLASADVLALGLRLAGGLEAIHALGIVHRDIAPDNILIVNENIKNAKLIDFGLASSDVGSEKSIIGDSFAGKLSYCAPEQLGLFGNKAQGATDVYALGLVLMKAAGLAVPGEGKGFSALEFRRADIEISDPRISPVLARALEAMLKADPADRVTELSALFTTALEDEEKRQLGAQPPRKDSAKPAGDKGMTAPEQAQATGRAVPRDRILIPVLVVAGLVAAVLVGSVTLSLDRAQSGPGEDVKTAREALAADDPLREVTTLIQSGTTENLNAALAALMAYQGDAANPMPDRQRAAILIARMYDPATYDTASSPFAAPNPAAARRYYKLAAALGSDEAQRALSRLSQ
ncbi:serine/threonine-protein kinase [Pseudodonghicola xiamenensis]|uniref:Serine/threonine protein kinase n=1 Tax=Pseudodonghicola xiamenensis TaxID=337702 RepID=A0A8J3HAU7_9RHOB|nr:serine/threonine-protein kinase [Pseudodonghicola xiamenensis]GHG98429.1 serine/threonine protein kinase [Pseudodonghicola xiamenensis]